LGEFFGDRLRRRCWAKSRDDLTVSADEEFGEIPGDVLFPFLVGMTRLQKFVEFAGSATVHFDFGKERKGGVKIGFDELCDLFVTAGFLTAELIAWEGENSKSRCLVFIVQGTQTCVLRSKSSFTRDVDDQADLSFVTGQRNIFTGDRSH